MSDTRFTSLHHTHGVSGDLNTRLRAGRPGFDFRQRQGYFSFRHRDQTRSGAQSASCSMITGSPLPGGKAAEA
jgi:hypothetical protein